LRASGIAVLMVGVALGGCAVLPGVPPERPSASVVSADSPLAPFSRLEALEPGGPWAGWVFHPSKRATRYRTVEVGGERVIEAVAESSVSGLRHAVDVDPQAWPVLEWRWRIDRMLEGADVADRRADDSPVRVVLAFEGDVSTLPVREQMFFERVRLLAGQDMPYATLMYVWCGRRTPGDIAVNAHTSRVRKIVVESGDAGVRRWRSYRRDIVADYERAFGRRPGRLVAVAVMTDSDNTRQRVKGWYGDIRLLPR